MALDDPISHDKMANLLRWVGGVGIVIVAAIRMVVVISPAVVFGSDPVLDSSTVTAIGPVGSVLLDVFLLTACVIAMFGDAMLRLDIDWKLLGLALLPLPVIAHHGMQDFESLWRESTWLAAAVAGVTIGHLARDRRLRLVLTALLLAAVLPVVVRGMYQVFVEHAQDVRFFQANREMVLQAQGMEPGSNAAVLYENRLRQAEASGWFGLANVFGSVMVAGTIAWVGIMLAGIKSKVPSGWFGIVGIAAGLCGVGLGLAGSKGALGAAAIGLVLWVLPIVLPTLREKIEGKAQWIPLALVALTLLIVAVRGALLPESFIGEKSVLFRWHYMVGSAEVILHNPLFGTSATGFQEAYVQYRLPQSPEAVASAHSMFVDWLAMLGIFGVSWIVLVVSILRRAGKDMLQNRQPRLKPPKSMKSLNWSVACVALFGIATGVMIELPMLDGAGYMARAVGILAFVAAAWCGSMVMIGSEVAIGRWAISAAAIALVIHAQIETTFWHPGSVVWAWCLIGMAGGRRSLNRNRSAIGTSIVVFVLAIVMVIAVLIPAYRQQMTMSDAERPLREIGQRRDFGNVTEAQFDVEREVRQRSANVLYNAWHQYPTNPAPLRAAIEQQLIAAQLTDAEDRRSVLSGDDKTMGAAVYAERLAERFPSPASYNLAANVWAEIARQFSDRNARERAIDFRRRIAVADPNGLGAQLRLADLLWEFDEHDAAIETYQRVLEIDVAWTLDINRQLTEEVRQRVEQRINSSD